MKLITTSVVRGSHQGESHGGVYLIDLERREVRQTLDWNKADIDWQGRGWDRGLRGIAFDGETVYIAASDELFAYTPDFKPLGSWRNPYLKHCHEIDDSRAHAVPHVDGASTASSASTSTSASSRWAMHVTTEQFRFKAAHLRSARQRRSADAQQAAHQQRALRAGRHVHHAASRRGGMLLFNGKSVQMAAELPAGSHNAQPFRDGVLFNDTEANAVRYAGRGEGREDRAMPVPRYRAETLAERRHGSRAGSRGRALRAACASFPDRSSPAAHRPRRSRCTTWRPTSGCCR